ncbi:MAG: RnfH family protein [Rhodanobacter sp.]
MAERLITVEVVYADAERQLVRRLAVAAGSTAMQAVMASGLSGLLPSGTLNPSRLGIFSRKVDAEHVLQAGDRVEIYRSLTLDPMEARRRRAREA